MIVICEECGKKYRVDPSKIKNGSASFKCKTCSHLITVTKPEEIPAAQVQPVTSAPIQETPPPPPPGGKSPAAAPLAAQPTSGPREAKKASKSPSAPRRNFRLGVRGKMILLFVVFPFILSGAAALYSLYQMNSISNVVLESSHEAIITFGEQVLTRESLAIAKRAGEYLAENPQLVLEDLQDDPGFKAILSSNVLAQGYPAVWARPDETGAYTIWFHPNPELVGTDLREARKTLGDKFGPLEQLLKNSATQNVVDGQYVFFDTEGRLVDKYMSAVLIPGTNLVLANTLTLNDLDAYFTSARQAATEATALARYVNLSVMAVAFVLIAGLVTLYGHRLTGVIKYLTAQADKISVGELDTEISVKSNDELGDLAEAVSRMQDSLRLSIQRLRRRR